MSENIDTKISERIARLVHGFDAPEHKHDIRQLSADAADLEHQLAEAREQIENLEIRHAATMMHGQTVVDDANLFRDQRDRLAKACRMLMRIIGPKEDPAWADDDQIEAAYNTGEEALAAMNQPGETRP